MKKSPKRRAVKSLPPSYTKQDILDMLDTAQAAWATASSDYIAAVDSGVGEAAAFRALTVALNNWNTAQTETLIWRASNP